MKYGRMDEQDKRLTPEPLETQIYLQKNDFYSLKGKKKQSDEDSKLKKNCLNINVL